MISDENIQESRMEYTEEAPMQIADDENIQEAPMQVADVIGVPIDVDIEIEREHKKDIRYLAEQSSQIREIMYDLNQQLEYDGALIRDAEQHTVETTQTLEDTREEIIKARRSQTKSIIFKGTVSGIVFGSLIGGPAGSILGYYTGGIIAGGILGIISLGTIGGFGSHYILKQKTN